MALLPFAPQIAAWEENRWALRPLDPEQTAKDLDRLARDVKQAGEKAKADLGKKALSPAKALRASRALQQLLDIFKHWFDHYNGYKPLFSWWCQTPYEAAVKELGEYQRFLKEDAAGQRGKEDDPLVGDPVGADRIANDLRREFIQESPQELIQIAEREYEWCLTQIKAAARDMGCGDDWKKAVELTKADHVPPGGQDDLVHELGNEAVEFVEAKDLVTLEPMCKETWRVEMLTAEQQKNWPFAFYGGQNMSTGYPLPEMDTQTKEMSMRGNNRHFVRAITFHELIPGHHLQAYMADRYRPYRKVFWTPFSVEGWALHWEMLMWDLGFPKSPMDKVGMLFWRMHRCARIVVSLKYHLGEMTPPQMIDYLVDKVGHERFTATSEVRRYIGDMYSPLYQCAYLIGGLQFRSLYKELVPAKMTAKKFHDAVLHLGQIPVSLVRLSLTGDPPPPDFAGVKGIRLSYE